jgi:Zn-dependent protease with chaperone function
MFNNILYFIVALLIFNVDQPGSAPRGAFLQSIAVFFLLWAGFAAYCRLDFRLLMGRISGRGGADGAITAAYHRLIFKHSILSIVLYTVTVFFLDLKYWIEAVSFAESFSVVQGLAALSVLMFLFCTLWYLAHPVYEVIFRPGITRRSFVLSNVRLNVPIVFPWILLSAVLDLMGLIRLPLPGGFLNRPEGQIVLFACFLSALMIFLPALVRVFWGCRPFPPSATVDHLKAFLDENAFRYRDLLRWPVFEGKMLTAGVMGLVPRYRYILISDALMAILSTDELKAVLAHEMAHVKHRHLVFFVIFFLGFIAVSYGLHDLVLHLYLLYPPFTAMLADGGSGGATLFYLLLSLPMLFVLLLYFRYVMGFFMRHFERQADLHSAVVMGTPEHTVSSLEKIALFSGRSRDIPSWHHFSIRERVACLRRSARDPGLRKRHNRAILVSLVVYLLSVGGLGYLVNYGPARARLDLLVMERVLAERAEKDPQDLRVLRTLAMVVHEAGRTGEAMRIYERIIGRDEADAVSLNNLAWLLATAKDRDLRDEGRALKLARRAVSLERSPMYLDTLAEAYYANGMTTEAVETIREAVAAAKENGSYYERQLSRFLAGTR